MSFLSVVIATYNRADTLRVALDRLRDQTLDKGNFEVIVVDDGSPDHTEAMVAEYLKSTTLTLKYLRHQNKGPGYTENRGIREAKGPWVLLIADDVLPEPDMLMVHFRTHEQNLGSNIAVAGKVLQSPDLPATVFQRNWDPFRYKNFEDVEALSYVNFWACNVSFKKTFMMQYGMFIERVGAAHEDTEVGWRLYRDGGLKLLYRRDALAYHYHPENIDSACRRAYERGKNFDVLAESVDDPGLYVRYHVLTRETWAYFLGGSKGAHAATLEEDSSAIKFLLRELVRRIVFNRATVHVIVPLIRGAEHNRHLAMLVSPKLIRGAVAYHFLRGIAELRGRRLVTPPRPAPESA
jgi:glycosyltransferase involved in cell wall biosynthesis